jgi:hypothetical protein
MSVAFRAAGAIAANNTETILSVIAPACEVNDVLIASIHGQNTQVVGVPVGWTKFVEVNNVTVHRATLAWKRAGAEDSGAAFEFTKPVDDNLVFAGHITAWSGCVLSGDPIDASPPSTNAGGIVDEINYSDFDPLETSAFVIALGHYLNGNTTPGAIAGTDPSFVNNSHVFSTLGTQISFFTYSGSSSGAATGARSHTTTSASNQRNIGVMFGLVEQPAGGGGSGLIKSGLGSRLIGGSLANVER